MVKYKQSFKQLFVESFLDRSNKVDHKRLTAFVFVILFIFTAVVAIFRQKEITNAQLVETILYIEGAVIGSAMGFSMINKPTTQSYESNEELYPRGDVEK